MCVNFTTDVALVTNGTLHKYGKCPLFLDGKLEVARNLRAAGIALEVIMQTTGLSREEIEKSV